MSEVHPIQRAAITVFLNGAPLAAPEGMSVAAVLILNGISTFRRTVREGRPRGVFCGMGICFDCVVLVDSRPVRACLTPVRDGMLVTT